MPFSEQLSADLVDLIISNTDITGYGADRYVALHDEDPTTTGMAGELSGDGYARTQSTFSMVEAATGKAIRNNAVVVFPAGTGTKAEQVTHYSVWDAASGGTSLGYGTLTAPANWVDGVSLSLAINALVMTVVNK